MSLPTYENKVLTGDKLVTLVSLIKGELANKAAVSDLDGFLIVSDIIDDILSQDTIINNTPEDIRTAILACLTNELGGDYDDGDLLQNAIQSNIEAYLIEELGGDASTDALADAIDGRIPDVSDFVTSSDVSTAISGKQDALVFNTAYNASSNKVATMSDIPDISGKQDALVFNTAYNASSNKVATMADIPSVSGFQTASDVQSAITSAISGITTFSFEIVQALPVSNISQTTIYLVLKSSGPSGNIYTEYAYVKIGTDSVTGNDIYGWETLGDTQADIAVLSTADVTAIWNYEPPAEEEDPGL